MLTLLKSDTEALSKLDIDSISIPSFGDEVILHKGKLVGMYIPDVGIVLEPLYAEVMRFNDIIRVGKNTDNGLLFGGYSITKKEFVISIKFQINNPDRGFWEQLKLYRISEKQNAAT